MNKKFKKIAALSAAVSIALSMGGCGAKKQNASDGDNVTLKYLFTGAGKLQDSDKVWKSFNEKLQKYMPGLKIDFQCVATSDYAEKWRLMMAAQEPVDIAWAGYCLDLTSEVGKNAYLPLDDLVDKYGKELKASMPEWVLEKSKINGKLYFIPCYQTMADQLPIGMRTPKELSDKYLDEEKMKETFGDSNKVLTKEDFKVVEDYLEALKKDGKLGKGVSPSFLNFFVCRLGWPRDLQPIIKNAYIKSESNDFHVYDTIKDFPASDDFYELTREWFEKGYIRNDILGLQDWSSDEGKKDGYAIWAHYINFEQEKNDSKKYGMDIKIVNVSDKIFANHTPSPTNTAIVKSCKNPETAMKFINLMNTEKGKELYNTLVYGIEGENYTKTGDDRVEMKVNGTAWTSQNKYGYQAWILGNTMNAYYNQFEQDGQKEYVEKEINEKAIVSPIMGFSFDTTAVSNEIAQYDSILKEYADIAKGAFPNWKELLNERNKKLKLAGSDKIVAEAQKQLDEFMKTKKK